MTPDELLEKYKDVLHKTFIETRTGKEYTYEGIWIDDYDYHFLMFSKENGKSYGLSCVGDFETHGFELVEE